MEVKKSIEHAMMIEALEMRYPFVLSAIHDDVNNLCEIGIIEKIQKIGGYKIKWATKVKITICGGYPNGSEIEISGKKNRQYRVFRTIAHHLNEILKSQA